MLVINAVEAAGIRMAADVDAPMPLQEKCPRRFSCRGFMLR
ncbi:hypothetical protein B4135_0892 [Caldibacillus debilis]|uniref:Uncharacterized protein n=1 Tax=Caldibacillus debilis TaxID=301148 RepID=A0A150M630_9BACI|nr:hypothetical protein B4135_0892 [Caldibacillus debilis]